MRHRSFVRHFALLAVLLLPALLPRPAVAQGDPVAWSEVMEAEAKLLAEMLASEDWAFRAMALMRLEKYEGDAIDEMIRTAVADEAWQVRSFAIRQAKRHSTQLDPALFEKEEDPRVIRAALRYQFPVPVERVRAIVNQLFSEKNYDALVLGIEIAAYSDDEVVRKEGAKRAQNLLRNINPAIAAVFGPTLARALDIIPAPTTLNEWQRWIAQQRTGIELGTPTAPAEPRSTTEITSINGEQFLRLRDYLGALRQRQLEMVITVDATNSMTPVIDAVKVDIDGLILFLGDLSSSLRLGLVAYRDHDNRGRLLEAHPFSTDIASIRNFLFGLQTPGGDTYPEAVFDGLSASRQFNWSRAAERVILIIGDAPPHEEDESKLRGLLEWFRGQGFTIHTVHVPMEWPEGMLQRMPPAQVQERERFRTQYNQETAQIFREMAVFGGGRFVALDQVGRSNLVRGIMKLTVEDAWWPQFDAFYDQYLLLCR